MRSNDCEFSATLQKTYTKWSFDSEKLRLAFTVYAAMRKQNWQNISVDKVRFSVKDIRDKLIPVLKESEAPNTRFPLVPAWAEKLVDECKSALSMILPFRKNEIEFLDQLQQYGELRPELISDDSAFCKRVSMHLLLHRGKKNKCRMI